MPSQARSQLDLQVDDVNELIGAHTALTGGGVGRPANSQGAAIVRAGLVLLAAAFEEYVEAVFEEAFPLMYPQVTLTEQRRFYKQTTERFNNADSQKVNFLFFNIGCPWIISSISWRKYPSEKVTKRLNWIIETRNSIAHGKQPSIRLKTLALSRDFILRLAQHMDTAIANHLAASGHTAPNW